MESEWKPSASSRQPPWREVAAGVSRNSVWSAAPWLARAASECLKLGGPGYGQSGGFAPRVASPTLARECAARGGIALAVDRGVAVQSVRSGAHPISQHSMSSLPNKSLVPTVTETKLKAEEAAVLRAILSKLAVRSRTGELGIVHGAERFVSTHLCLSKTDRAILAGMASKLGLNQGVQEVS